MVYRVLRAGLIAVLSLLILSPVKTTSAVGEEPWVIEVNDTSDAPDFVHNSVCSAGAPTGGPCTLRAAIDEANQCEAVAGACEWGVVIRVPPGTYTLTIPPIGENDNSTGDLDIYPQFEISTMTIEGTDQVNPPVIDANGLDRVFHSYNTSIPITLRNLIIRDGTLIKIDENTYGMEGAGILNYGHLTLENVIIENNQIICPSNNTDFCEGGGGGIFTGDYLLMKDSTVRNNTAFVGGGVFISGSAEVKIISSTVSDNLAVYGGGGILNFGEQFQIENSTISDNTSDSFGGIFNLRTMNLYNVTIASNITSGGGAANLHNSEGGIINISNSIIAYPIGPYGIENCMNLGNWTTLGINLYSDSSCGTGEDNLSNTDPRLTPLAWLGGPTMTRGLLPGSPAHDATIVRCQDSGGIDITEDQRGVNRDAQCDLGAFEGVAYGIYLPMIHR